jgi:hypothetical protein
MKAFNFGGDPAAGAAYDSLVVRILRLVPLHLPQLRVRVYININYNLP